jgi:hypothetical protein
VTESLRGIGFWFEPVFPSDLPSPEALAASNWDADEKAAVVRYLRSGHHYETYRGWSWCRFNCGAEDSTMGHSEFTDGVWVWPEGLSHYVEVHDVELPEEFVEAALSKSEQAETKARFSLDWWIRWGKEREAWVDLSKPWEIITDWDESRNLVKELRRELPHEHVLEGKSVWPVARGLDRDDVLFIIEGDERLALVHLTWGSSRETDPHWPSTRLIDGWGAWNADRKVQQE